MTSPFVRLSALALAASTILGADGVLGQTTKPSPPPPQKIDLIGVQSWQKVCQKDAVGTKELCRLFRPFGQTAEQPALAILVEWIPGEDRRLVNVQLPEGFLLRPGFRILTEKGDPIGGRYSVCAGGTCFGDAEMNTAGFNVFKKSPAMGIVVQSRSGSEITFNVPMKEFSAAFDGPAIDPKVLEQQNQELQHQLEEKARQQREQLEKQSGVQPTPAPTPPK